MKKINSLFTCILIMIVFAACHNYYKATSVNKGSGVEQGKSIDSLKLQNRYFVLHNGSETYYMKGLTLSADQKTLECTLDTLSPDHKLHLTRGHRGKMQYSKHRIEDLGVTNEVHLYIPQDNAAAPGRYTLSLDKVQKIEVLQHDKKRTTSSYVIGAIAYTLGAAVVVGIIIAATKSSCPFVSAYDGNQFSLQGEIYGGAIYPQLARYDFLPLKMAPLADGSLQLKISNELQERQYTDIADLWVITHDKNTKVLADEKGNLYSIADPKTPEAAWLNDKKNVLSALTKAADNELLYMDDSTRADASNEVMLHFKKPINAQKGKLFLALKNSYWLDLLYGELAKGFGTYYATYMKQQQNKPAAELLKWTYEQQIPMEVSLKTSAGWKKISDITTIGPLATREIVVPFDLSSVKTEKLEIKLSSGFMFWELDYAAMDYTDDDDITIQKLTPVKATDELGIDVSALLRKEDGYYLEQPQIGNVASLTYKNVSTAGAGKTSTFILKTKGYYEHVRDFKNNPDAAFLQQFTKPNAFPVFGMSLYKKIREENIRALASSN